MYDPAALDPLGIDRFEASDVYGRVASRIVRLIGAPHADGAGYDPDTRLRPSGEQGHLVVSLEAFRAYHGEPEQGHAAAGRPHAADWERQALIRLRPVAGDHAVGKAVAAIATEAAYERTPVQVSELLRLRARLEREISGERPDRFNVKLGKGGLTDVEFAVQYLQMRHGKVDRRVRTTETLAALDSLEAGRHLDADKAAIFRNGYRFLRKLEQRARVVHGARTAPLLGEGAPGLTPLARSMGYRDGLAGSSGEQLLRTYREVTAEVRTAFLTVAQS